MFIVYLLLAIVSFIFVKKKEGTYFDPASIIVGTWCVFPAINSLHPCSLYALDWRTHFCILLSFFSFMFYYYGNNRKMSRASIPTADFSVNYKILIALNAAVVILLIGKSINAWNNIGLVGWAMQRHTGFEDFGSSIDLVLFDLLAKPIIYASSVIFAVLLANGKKINIVFLALLIINIAQDVVLFAARASIIKLILYMVFAFFFLTKRKYTKFQKLGFVCLVVVVFMVNGFITQQRNIGIESNTWETMVVYYIAPFNVLDYYIKNPSFSHISLDNLNYGLGIFGCFTNIIAMGVYVLFGTKYYGTDNSITQITGESVPVSPTIEMNAACTADYCFLMDFSYLGIIVGFGLMAYCIAKAKKLYFEKQNMFSATLYVFMLYEIFRLSVFYDFVLPSYLFTIVFIWLFTKHTGKNVASN
ncbi:O-antigen polymerase [Segatella copri]|uniref:Uncharacterized protein n=1 Tax=Segatella copri DSM 18205 TaxID=537011 RepID=D1PFE9_9BACT|nr:O-antigen polymerase [Segatella copri]EFB34522.1 hypothetical protein PREVCOP_05956 [Segatella copri DSM 18205]MCW4097696.1 oligosaccharide repeat unit polymerase [Segatella copri]MQP20714.1 oligosaccharide repeat unit polymerase [Segatella copri DSM 18205]UEA44411.1 oligosaccharide repeat unit polymerase [Segatella copri DSM 18205]